MTSDKEHKTWQTIQVGDQAEKTLNITEEMVMKFADITGDHNPIHIDKEFAKKTVFRKPVVHGAFQASLISGLLAEELPGRGSIYASQTLTFLSPLFVGETLTIQLKVKEKIEAKKQVKIETICKKEDGSITLQGEAFVYPARR